MILSVRASELRDIVWKQISDHHQVKVFVPESFNHSSGLIPIKFETILNFNISKILSVLADNPRKKEWVPRLVEGYVLNKNSDADTTIYYKYNLPWPLADRDFIIRNIGKYDKDKNLVSVDMISVEHNDDPALKMKTAVRGRTIDGYSLIRPLGENQTSIEMALLNDFGGNIPKFIINFIQKKWPDKFVKNIRTQLQKNDIKINPSFIFDQPNKSGAL